jgi:hypothetical protein
MRRVVFSGLVVAMSALGACSLRDLSDLTSGGADAASDVDAALVCPKDCLGGECVNGKCQPVTLVANRPSPWGIAVDQGTVFWSELGPSGVPGAAYRFEEPDGGRTFIKTYVDPTWLTVFEGHLLWTGMTSPFAVGRCPTSGAGCTFLSGFNPFPAGTIVASGAGPYVNHPDRAVADATGVYWTNAGSSVVTRDGSVVVCRATGCGSPPPQQLALFQSHPRGIAIDDTYVYWVNQGLGTETTDGAVLRIPKAPGGIAEKLADSLQSPAYLAIDDNHVYWTNGGTGTVMVVSKSGGDARVFADGQGGAWDIAVDGTGVYWTTLGPSGTIATCPLSGCDAGVKVLAEQSEPYGIALDDKAVYWTTFDPMAGTVMKLAKP